MSDNVLMQGGQTASRNAASAVLGQEESDRLVEFVCLDPHRAEPLTAAHHSPLATHEKRWAYCAQAGAANHQWVRVPATPLDKVTTGKMEDRPPAPRITRSG